MLKNLLMAVGSACVMAVVGAACSSGPVNVCVDKKIRCSQAGYICDPGDGVCKCGGRGGVVCADSEVCDATTNTCLSNVCKNVDCGSRDGGFGTSCDVHDGQCKCGGTGGTVCGDNELCNPNARVCEAQADCNQVACPRNQACDTTTSHCVCGSSQCNPTETCSAGDGGKVCVPDNCTGVACTGAASCDGADGLCKCNGLVCQSGQACACPPGSDAGCATSALACRTSNLCSTVTCNNGTTCDPADGQCKCGGPGGPVCASNQICNLGPPPQCEGGEQCAYPDGGAKVCPGGTSCDPEDGVCKCGGRGGLVCADAQTDDAGVQLAPAEICVSNPVQLACRRPCKVTDPACADGTYCYFDSSAAPTASYCAAPTGTKQDEDGCTTATACFSQTPSPHPLHCLGLALGQTGICRAYCDVAAGQGGCVQDIPRTCDQIPNGPAGIGYCHPSN